MGTKIVYRQMRDLLTAAGMDAGEAQATALLLMEEGCGISAAQALTDSGECHVHEERLLGLAHRVADGEPAQYVLGRATFCGLAFAVRPGVLIPRPETAELVEWVSESMAGEAEPPHVLDIGTGSGCIAITLAHRFPHAQVEAWDISPEALAVARENAARHRVDVTLRQVDALREQEGQAGRGAPPCAGAGYSVIVSNPPYICEEEAAGMEARVLDHEPANALFVPDDDPLLFYRRIARLARRALRGSGLLFFEINRRFGRDIARMLQEAGFCDVTLRRDQFGNDRMVRARQPQHEKLVGSINQTLQKKN